MSDIGFQGRSARWSVLAALGIALLIRPAGASDCTNTSIGAVPINDLGAGLYLGFYPGGLYPGSLNVPPQFFHQIARQQAVAIVPRLPSGQPSPQGKLVLLSIGMSNTTQEFCGGPTPANCVPPSFMAKAAASDLVDHDHLVIVDGAAGGQTAATWDDPADRNYDRVRDDELTPLGLSEAQVAAVWIKVADASPSVSLPDPGADAIQLSHSIASIARAVHVRYPNCRLAFVSSRIYAGYASTQLNPEPFAYESGFAVKWVIQEQISQAAGAQPSQEYGLLTIGESSPVLVWGPYLWADGLVPRSDGLTWACPDFQNDGTHPSPSGVGKVGDLLMAHFLDSPYARPWFRAPKSADLDGDGEVNAADLSILLGSWGPCGNCPIDLDWDGFVGSSDLAILLAAWTV